MSIYNANDLTTKILNLCDDAKHSDLGFVEMIGALTTARLLHEQAFLKAQEKRKCKRNYNIRNKKKVLL